MTATELRFLRLLSDGEPHGAQEFLAELADAEQGSILTVYVHIHKLRCKLRRRGEDVVCRCLPRGKTAYQHVRHLLAKVPADDVNDAD